MAQAMTALSAGVVGVMSSAVSFAADTSGAGVAPWLQFGGTGAAVGALAYIAKLFADGKLVAVPITDWQKAQAVSLAAAMERERVLTQLTQEAQDREQRLWAMLAAKGS